MAAITMRLKDVLESCGGSYDFVDGRMIVTGAEHIGLGHYEIFNEAYRDVLNGMIFSEYMNREIAHETDAIFRVRVANHMNMNMARFNKMYESTLMEIDPLNTIDLVNTNEHVSTQSTTGSSDNATESLSDSQSRAVTTDTPQSQLSGNADYASSGADSKSLTANEASGTQSSNTDTTMEDSSESRQRGYTGHAAELLQRYRESLISVDAMVVASLSPYFMMVVDTPFPYTARESFYYGY